MTVRISWRVERNKEWANNHAEFYVGELPTFDGDGAVNFGKESNDGSVVWLNSTERTQGHVRNPKQFEVISMGFAEIQFSETTFFSLLQTLASIAPNPFQTFDFLPKGQLIRSMSFVGDFDFGPPSGLKQAPGTLVVSLPVTINHVSIDQLEADANDAGTDLSATLWAAVSMADTSVAITIVRVDAGNKHHLLASPVSLMSEDLSLPLDGITVHGSGVLHDAKAKVVVFRLAIFPPFVSLLLASPVIDHTAGQAWAIFIDQSVLTSSTRDRFAAELAVSLTPEDGKQPEAYVEDAATVTWNLMPNGSWGMTIRVGIVAIDACPALIGDDVNMSVEVIGAVEIAPNLEESQLDLKLHVSHDTSDWDSFRCGLQNLLSLWLVSFTEPLLGGIWGGFLAPIITAVMATALPQLIDVMATEVVGKQDQGDEFEKLSKPEGDDDATYEGSLPLPSLPAATVTSAEVDFFGLTVRGSMLVLPGHHQMTITPPAVSGGWDDRYSCSTFKWEPGEYLCTPVTVTDAVSTGGGDIIDRPSVILFGTTEARPRKNWKVELNQMASTVTVMTKATPEPGTTGRLWVHSSAGLASVPIVSVSDRPPAPTGTKLVNLKVACQKTGNQWVPGGFNLQWLVDPPPYEAIVDVLRQWVVQVPNLAKGSTIDVATAGPGIAQRFQLKGGGTRNTIALTTASTQTLQVTVGGSTAVTAVLSQRLLIAFAARDLGSPILALTRTSAGEVAALTEKKLCILAADCTELRHQPSQGATGLARDRGGMVAWGNRGAFRISETTTRMVTDRPVSAVNRSADGSIVFHGAGGQFMLKGARLVKTKELQVGPVAPAQVHTVTLASERVMVALGSRVYLTQPWGARRNIIL